MLEVRAAVHSDKEGVFSFLPKVFAEDYIQDCWDLWMKETGGRTFVALFDGKHVGVIHVFVENDYGWLEAIRIHPDYQRHGIGLKLSSMAIDFAKQHGAKRVRLSTSSANDKAQNQVKKMGFYELVRFARPFLDNINCPKTTKKQVKLDLGSVSEYVKKSDCYRNSKGLYATDWRWKPLTETAIQEFVSMGNFIAHGRDGIEGLLLYRDSLMLEKNTLEISFIDGTDWGVREVVKTLLGIASNEGKKIYGFVPNEPGIVEKAQKAGLDMVGRDMIVFEKPLT